MGVTAAAWHATNAAAIPASATAVLVTAVAVVAAHVAWTWWLIRRPSAVCLLVGAIAVAAELAATAALLSEQGAQGPGVGFAQIVGVTVQLTLLALVVAGLARSAPASLHRLASGLGLACVAVTLCVTVAGGRRMSTAPPGSSSRRPLPAPPSFSVTSSDPNESSMIR